MRPETFLQALDDEAIVAAIRQAESRTRGEIRVHVSDEAVPDAVAAGAAAFERLGMTATAERNAVLVFLAPANRAFAVLGDTGIHARCDEGFWDEVASAMRGHFEGGRFTAGIVAGIAKIADELARHFPRRPGEDDRNELPDAVSRDG